MMEQERPSSGTHEHARISLANLRMPKSLGSLHENEHYQIHRLKKEPHEYCEQEVKLLLDRTRKDAICLVGMGDAPSYEYEITGKGDETIPYVVGYVNASIGKRKKHGEQFSRIDEFLVDHRVDVAVVRRFLLEGLQKRVRQCVSLAGIHVVVPLSERDLMELYADVGFQELNENYANSLMEWRVF